ncbi:thiamine pyrophosphate-dependent enzyme, partial [Bacteroidota bacterium]
MFRPITLFPFPKKEIRELAKQVKGMLVVEMNAGQMIEDVQLSVGCDIPIKHYGRFGGIIPTPDEVVKALEECSCRYSWQRWADKEANMEEKFAHPELRIPENLVYKRTDLLVDCPLSYCPGCGHGTVHRMLMEVLEEKEIASKTIGVNPVGCSVLAYDFMNIDMLGAAHGRAPAVATAIKRLWPDRYVFTYQGDGDLAAIGTAETIHACNRGENFTIIFINNGIYGMTGGQMAPTTLPGMR